MADSYRDGLKRGKADRRTNDVASYGELQQGFDNTQFFHRVYEKLAKETDTLTSVERAKWFHGYFAGFLYYTRG